MAHHFICSREVSCGDQQFLIHIYTGPRRRGGVIHTAETMFEPGDNIVSDGYSLEEVLTNVKNILPLALRSRLLLREIQSS